MLDADLLVAESDRPVEPAPGWEVVRAKRYGTTHVTFLRGATEPDPRDSVMPIALTAMTDVNR